MINLNEYIEDLKTTYEIDALNFKESITCFFVSNNWFGDTPTAKNGVVYVEKDFIEKNGAKIEEFCRFHHLGYSEKVKELSSNFAKIMPQTSKLFQKYVKEKEIADSVAYRLTDFLMYYLPGELPEADIAEIHNLLEEMFDNLSKTYADILTDFINWVQTKTKTIYTGFCSMNEYYKDETRTSSYSQDGYLEILYHLFNQGYIDDNDMYAQAAQSKDYADTWLYLSMHFISALRDTDLKGFPHPTLYSEPSEVLRKVENYEFTDEEAVQTLYSVLWTLEATQPKPNKTKNASGIGSIKFFVPQSAEVHIGTLYAIAEAHFRLSGADCSKPLIRPIKSYEQINRYMGEEIGDLFLSSNFRARAANKSYMQMVYLLTDDILGINDEFNVKGYMLAALARSHKGSYGEFAQTTSIYLKDAKMSGWTPEFVAKEMFERGALSSIASMLLKMVTNGEYNKLSVGNQTKMIQQLNMSPSEIEKTVEIMQVNTKAAIATAESIYQNCSKEEILNILHKIGNGEAVSKTNSSLCLQTAMGCKCPFAGASCAGCQYEISTKWTMLLMAKEYKRLESIYLVSVDKREKEKSARLAQNIVIPAIEEMLTVLKENYGKETTDSLEKIITEVLDGI